VQLCAQTSKLVNDLSLSFVRYRILTAIEKLLKEKVKVESLCLHMHTGACMCTLNETE